MSVVDTLVLSPGDDLCIMLIGDINDRECVFVVAETNLVIVIPVRKNNGQNHYRNIVISIAFSIRMHTQTYQ